jgi:hypothetical protein
MIRYVTAPLAMMMVLLMAAVAEARSSWGAVAVHGTSMVLVISVSFALLMVIKLVQMSWTGK